MRTLGYDSSTNNFVLNCMRTRRVWNWILRIELRNLLILNDFNLILISFYCSIFVGSDGNGILLHCPFKLAFEHEDVKGEIFMSTRNEKLFIAVPVDDLILSSQPRNDENDGNNGEDNSVMTESVTIHEFTSVELGKDDNLGKNGGSLFSEPCSVCTTIEEAPFENAQWFTIFPNK